MADVDDAELRLRFEAKDALRKRIAAVRRAMPREAVERRSDNICQRVRDLPEWKNATTVALYMAMRSEANPAELMETAWREGKTVTLPWLGNLDDDMVARRHESTVDLVESGYGFLQPPDTAPVVESVDLVVVPALAVDERGYRIGWGKGFYDRFLASIPGAFRTAIVFDFQLLAEVPNTPHDVPMHCMVTDVSEHRARTNESRRP